MLMMDHLADKEKKKTSKINWKNVEKVGELREQPTLPTGATLQQRMVTLPFSAHPYPSSFQRACVSMMTGVRRLNRSVREVDQDKIVM
jgi:hypothetical protein